MEAQISILVFPQRIAENRLHVNVLTIPRNFNPLVPNPLLAPYPAWVEAQIKLKLNLIASLESYPILLLPVDIQEIISADSNQNEAKAIFETLKLQFDISEVKTLEKAEAPGKHHARKYLPSSYRKAFNFTKTRTKHAVIDDSYACALKEETKPEENFIESTNSVSWGKVFAFCMRQPAIAKKCGFIHEAAIDIPEGLLQNGGWLYADVADDSDYSFADKTILKRYAARLPKIQANEERVVFASVLFPVRHDDITPAPDNPDVPTNFDQLLLEASVYDDGFAKIVHAEQPVSDHLLKEKRDAEFPVSNDAGIRLGWDDEQLLIWMNRQLEEDPTNVGQRVDAPMGVIGYRVDVREHKENPDVWTSLCQVNNKAELTLGEVTIDSLGATRELSVEVYPAVPDGKTGKPFWLPAYFAYWIGNSLVLQDEDAIDLYQKEQNQITKKDTPQQAKKNLMYAPVGIEKVPLRYGKNYAFRVRLADLSGGGATSTDVKKYDAESPEAHWRFRRHAIPQTLNILNDLPQGDNNYFTESSLKVKRPRIGYPSALFTGYPDALDLLKADFEEVTARFRIDHKDPEGNRPIGIFDPDVDKIEIEVAVRALDMDTTITKHHPQDNFAVLYTTTRNLPDEIDGTLELPITFVDSPLLKFVDSKDLFLLGLSDQEVNIDKLEAIVLPTNRDIQITLRAKCAIKEDYYVDNEPLSGVITRFFTRKAATNEQLLFKTISEQAAIQGIYLRPSEQRAKQGISLQDIALHGEWAAHKNRFLSPPNPPNQQVTSIENLATAIDVQSRGLSLIGKQGQRWQFGAAQAIRHTLAPDNTSITFSTEEDLLNHWLVPITLMLNRDWTWDGIMPDSFKLFRKKKFSLDQDWESETQIGSLELKKGINLQALIKADRSQTFLCFIDAVETKSNDSSKYPDEILVEYRVEPNYKMDNPDIQIDEPLQFSLHLPITTAPSQIPKVVSAGLAMSQYKRDENYANTEVRERYLWVEFEAPIQNPRDAFFGRITGYSPDPLLAEWTEDWMSPQEPPALAIEPEPRRIISPGHSDDQAGLNAMQQLIPANDSQRHFLVPLPQGLHPESPELFGFFTYEFRVGHLEGWSTAQGRFGRAQVYKGIQHPLPQLYHQPSRDEKQIQVTAHYAEAVFDGRNVTAQPSRTQLWALLYAQVRTADASDNRNILLQDRLMQPVQKRKFDAQTGMFINPVEETINIQQAQMAWSNAEVANLLKKYGLHANSPLSVLCVEILPNGEQFLSKNYHDHHDRYHRRADRNLAIFSTQRAKLFMDRIIYNIQQAQIRNDVHNEDLSARPLSDDLGHYRILRTSTLVAVPEICCVDC